MPPTRGADGGKRVLCALAVWRTYNQSPRKLALRGLRLASAVHKLARRHCACVPHSGCLSNTESGGVQQAGQVTFPAHPLSRSHVSCRKLRPLHTLLAAAPRARARTAPPRRAPCACVSVCVCARAVERGDPSLTPARRTTSRQTDRPTCLPKNARRQKMRSDGNSFPPGRKVLTEGFKEAAAGGPQ